MTKFLLTALFLPSVLMAYEYGPDPRYTGAPGDFPLACSTGMCHTGLPAGGPLNAYGGGVHATFSSGSSYTPGGPPITITVSVSDPVNTHYGFQMTARLASDLMNGQAGDFATGGTSSCPAVAVPCEIVICDDGSVKLPGKKCPTASPVEFVEHSYPKGSQVSTTPYTFTWTPPATNVGQVHFYIAGNAVNGDLMADAGDHVYTADYLLTPVLCSGSPPVVNSVVSLSAFGERPAFTSGSWLEVYGSNFTAANTSWQWQGTDFSGVNAPTSLAGITASINGIPAYVYYLSAGQIDVLAPADTALASVPVVVSSCTQASAPFTAQRIALAPGLLAPPGFLVNGKQYLAAQFNQDLTFVGNPSVVPGTTRPAKPGDLIVVYGIGFGEADDASGPIAPGTEATDTSTLKNPLTVAFGTTQASLVYAGLAPGNVGLYQFDITVPQVPDGDTPINVTLNGVPLPQQLYLPVKN
jgi:uncharacterized protein (TIGR03437 family)